MRQMLVFRIWISKIFGTLMFLCVLSHQQRYSIIIQSAAGRGSSIESVYACHTSGPEFDPDVRHILSWRLAHEKISTSIRPLPLIQEEQLSVTGERMCTKYW